MQRQFHLNGRRRRAGIDRDLTQIDAEKGADARGGQPLARAVQRHAQRERRFAPRWDVEQAQFPDLELAGDLGRQVGPLVVPVEVARGGVLDRASASTRSAGRQQCGQDGATDDAEEVWLAGTAGLLGREDPGGGDELVTRGL